MSFIDEAHILVKAGNGGAGAVSFRREKFIPKGGPDGGNGGKGGNVYITATRSMKTLMDFRYKRKYFAEDGHKGAGALKTGKDGIDLTIKVPCGTQIFDIDTDELLIDLLDDKQTFLLAKSGDGGFGNDHYKSSSNQTPLRAQPGFPGEEKNIKLELKLLADVGLVGCPNAGKSSLLARISAATPKIASYPFTTLEPNLGIVHVAESESFVAADIPGLLEGAHDGKGLGDKFLKHIERTKVLIHVIDSAGVDGRKPIDDFKAINHELSSYSPKLAKLPQVVVLNKIDLPEAKDNIKAFKKAKIKYLEISCATNTGMREVIFAAHHLLKSSS